VLNWVDVDGERSGGCFVVPCGAWVCLTELALVMEGESVVLVRHIELVLWIFVEGGLGDFGSFK
jgi:hypothetical protein